MYSARLHCGAVCDCDSALRRSARSAPHTDRHARARRAADCAACRRCNAACRRCNAACRRCILCCRHGASALHYAAVADWADGCALLLKHAPRLAAAKDRHGESAVRANRSAARRAASCNAASLRGVQAEAALRCGAAAALKAVDPIATATVRYAAALHWTALVQFRPRGGRLWPCARRGEGLPALSAVVSPQAKAEPSAEGEERALLILTHERCAVPQPPAYPAWTTHRGGRCLRECARACRRV